MSNNQSGVFRIRLTERSALEAMAYDRTPANERYSVNGERQIMLRGTVTKVVALHEISDADLRTIVRCSSYPVAVAR